VVTQTELALARVEKRKEGENMNEMVVDNTFKSDFTIAEAFGTSAILDTYKRAFKEWHDDYKMLTALVMALNHKIWEHHRAGHKELTVLYNQLWQQADIYAYTHLTDDALAYFLEVTD
jgi:hypothetical protein